MKKTILIRTLGQIMIGAAISAISVSAFAGKTLDRVEKTKQLVVTVSAKWPPHAFLNDKHQLVGFDIDVAKEIAKSMGAQTKFDTPSFDLFTGGHWHGRWDMAVFSITTTNARANILYFPASYYYTP